MVSCQISELKLLAEEPDSCWSRRRDPPVQPKAWLALSMGQHGRGVKAAAALARAGTFHGWLRFAVPALCAARCQPLPWPLQKSPLLLKDSLTPASLENTEMRETAIAARRVLLEHRTGLGAAQQSSPRAEEMGRGQSLGAFQRVWR